MAEAGGSKKQTKGRQKIEMKKIENEDDRLITFSKRRSGIYKKASELATLCGAEVGVVVFSPAGKPFSFAHPSIESVANKFLNSDSDNNMTAGNDNNVAHPLVEAHRRVRINELNQNHNQLLSQLDAEKEKGKALEKLKKVRGTGRGWWETPAEELGMEELQQVDASLGDLYQNVCHQLKERGVIGSSSYNTNPNPSINPNMNTNEDDQGEETNPFNILANGAPPPPNFDYGQFHHHHHP